MRNDRAASRRRFIRTLVAPPFAVVILNYIITVIIEIAVLRVNLISFFPLYSRTSDVKNAITSNAQKIYTEKHIKYT